MPALRWLATDAAAAEAAQRIVLPPHHSNCFFRSQQLGTIYLSMDMQTP